MKKVKTVKKPWVKGLVIFSIVVGFSLLSAYSLYALQNKIKDSFNNSQQNEESSHDSGYVTEMRGDFPSSCGFSAGWPTTVVESNPYMEWTYEEIGVTDESFYRLAPTASIGQGVLLASVQFKDKANTFHKQLEESDTFYYSDPGFVAFCVNNTSNLTLDEFVEFALKTSDDQYEVTLSGPETIMGEIKFQPINIKGIKDGNFVNAPFYLAVMPEDSDYSRLVILQPWAGSDNRIETDRQAILDSLQYRNLSSKMSVTTLNSNKQNVNSGDTNSATNTASNCERLTIYEGIFKSDKCYSSADYKELNYYLSRYNSAVFDQNAAARSSQITCNGSEFFKDKCEEDKQRYEKALKDQEGYKVAVEAIIARGK